MNKYKVGDKIVLTVSDVNEKAYYSYYVFNNNDLILWEPSTDNYAEPLSAYTEPLEAKIRRQAAEITRLLAKNKELKEDKAVLNAKIDAYKLYGDQHEEEYNQAFNQGAEAAWELVRKIFDMETNDIEDIFIKEDAWNLGTVLNNYTYQEAAAKVAEWEKAKEEIKVGDVYMSRVGNYFVIYDIDHEKGIAKILWSDLSNSARELEDIKEYYIKTGRHIDIDGFLKQIGR